MKSPRNIPFLLLHAVSIPQSASAGFALCALGIATDGTEHLLEIQSEGREDEHGWPQLLRALQTNHLSSAPLLVCCDGDPTLIAAIRATFPGAALQLSVPHRIAALSRKVDPRWRTAVVAGARRIFQAQDRDGAAARFREWRNRWLDRGVLPVRDLEADLALCLAFYRFPANVRSKLRSVSGVKRALRVSLRANDESRRSADAPTVHDGADEAGTHTAPAVAPKREHSVPVMATHERRAAPAPSTTASGTRRLDASEPAAIPIHATRPQTRVQEPPKRSGALMYGLWVLVCLTAFLAYTGAAELPDLFKPSPSAPSPSPATVARPIPSGGPAASSTRAAVAPQIAPQVSTPVPAAAPPAQPSAPVESSQSAPLLRGVTVVVSASRPAWIRVRADGVKVFESALRAGEVRRWSAQRILQIRTGNAGAVSVVVNGQPLGVLGRVGQIASRVFTRSNRP